MASAPCRGGPGPAPLRGCLPDSLERTGRGGAARSLGARAVVPIHFEGWTHFTQGADALRAAFAGNQLTDRLALADPGASVTV